MMVFSFHEAVARLLGRHRPLSECGERVRQRNHTTDGELGTVNGGQHAGRVLFAGCGCGGGGGGGWCGRGSSVAVEIEEE